MPVTVVFRGDAAEARALVEAIGHNCSCAATPGHCEAHLMLMDQRLLDRLLFARWLVERLIFEEHR